METPMPWILGLSPSFSVPVAAVLGLVLGSFYTACIHRYVAELSLIRPLRSFCPHCGTSLAWYDNLPLLSYLLLRGRCRHCKRPIGLRYPAVEFLSLAWAVALVLKFGLSLPWLIYMVFGGLFIVGSFIDFELYILPNRITLGGAVLALAVQAFFGWAALKGALVGAMAGGGFFWVLQQGYRIVRREEGLGTGDVKLMLCIGALVGVGGLPMTILAAAVSALAASVVYMRHPDGSGVRTRIPFGPFLCLGAMLHILAGNEVLAWYFSLYR
ncbi:prepilin peptidase [Salidesulfovibrio onnuriiensis]|uniref:prepilin peptidase n=1 Tax=Salidesulfovibrio onnuriiensis TaxID=2583823 RepID=UPI0011C7FB32|nr:A24 family peptidase [Salidesulfovibrio onnuriiensis]